MENIIKQHSYSNPLRIFISIVLNIAGAHIHILDFETVSAGKVDCYNDYNVSGTKLLENTMKQTEEPKRLKTKHIYNFMFANKDPGNS